MSSLYIFVVAVVVAAHFAFIGYLLVGGFVALRWPHTIPPHILAVIWGVLSISLNLPCPLTYLERWARSRAGMAPLPSDGFIAHYITGVLYPAKYLVQMRLLVALVVLVSWLGWWYRRRRRAFRT